MSAHAATHDHHGPVAWPRDAQYGTATPGKIGMWIFLVSDAFSFAAFLIANGILRSGAAVWQQPGEPPLGINFTAGLTVLLVLTSLTNVIGYTAAVQGKKKQATWLLALTALGGLLFLVGQYQEWFGIWGPGLVHEGLVFGHSARASIFYVTTGFHGLHVLAGVVYMLAVTVGYLRGKAGPGQIELMSLFWCFVDFVWIFVFTFIYLFP